MLGIRSTTPMKEWLPIFSIGCAAFVFVTTELMPVGLLSEIAASFEKTESSTGLLITFYAWSVALASLPLTILSEKMDRKKLLLIIFSVFIISHILAATSTNFTMLMFARICIAMSHAIFWSITTPLASRLAPKRKMARSLAIVITGASLATVLGVPLGKVMGQQLGWRVSFGAIGIIALSMMVILWKTLPSLPSTNTNNIKSLPGLLHRKTLIKLFIITLLLVTAYFCAFSYLTPFFSQVSQVSKNTSTLILLILGMSGIVGSFFASKFIEKYPKLLIVGGIFLVGCCLFSLLPFSKVTPMLILTCVLWGAAMACVGMSFQTVILSVASDATDMAMSIYSGTFNIGIGAGAFLGSNIYSFFGIEQVGNAGAIFAFLAFLLAFSLKTSEISKSPENLETDSNDKNIL